MARGRFVAKQICVDKKVNSLSSPWSMLAYTWLITHADCEGRTYGDPAIVKSMVFPRQEDKITTHEMEGFIREWAAAGMIEWYEVEGDLYIEFIHFEKHQPGLRKEREPASIIPAFIQQTSGKHPANIRKTSGSLQAEVEVEVEVKGEGEGEVKAEPEQKTAAAAPAPLVMNSFQTGDPFYIRVWSRVTGMAAIPGGEIEKVLNALEGLRGQYPNEDQLVAYLQRYYDDWQKRKRKDGRSYSRSNCAWVYDLAVAGDPVKDDLDHVQLARADPNCPICLGNGWVRSDIDDIHDPKFGKMIRCTCVK